MTERPTFETFGNSKPTAAVRQVRALSDRRSHINVEDLPAGGHCDVQKVLAE